MKDGFVPRPKLVEQFKREIRKDMAGATAAWNEAMAQATKEMTTVATSTDDIRPPPARAKHPYEAIQKRHIELRDTLGYGRRAAAIIQDEFNVGRRWVYTTFRKWSTQTDKKE
jgi:hypothetical protein